jgi:hypothetical protein
MIDRNEAMLAFREKMDEMRRDMPDFAIAMDDSSLTTIDTHWIMPIRARYQGSNGPVFGWPPDHLAIDREFGVMDLCHGGFDFDQVVAGLHERAE